MAPGASHSPRRVDVERIVREVLSTMQASGATAGGTIAAGAELVLSSKVVSLAEIEGRLHGVTRVVVPRGAILTPAARDVLRTSNVAVASAVGTLGSAASGQQLVFGVAETNYDSASLASLLTAAGIPVERLPQVGLTGVIDEMCERVVKGGEVGVLFTAQTAASLCLANRQQGARAALGLSPRGVAEDVAAIGTNLLVVDPRGKSLFALRQMTHEMARGGRRSPPAALAARLG